jgi:exosome complex exonuclease RRP6
VQNALGLCLERSRQLCLQLYEKPLLTDRSHIDVYYSFRVQLSPQQLSVLAAVYAWRDRMARELDDGPSRIIPKSVLLALAQAMPTSPPAVQRLTANYAPIAYSAAEEVCLPPSTWHEHAFFALLG